MGGKELQLEVRKQVINYYNKGLSMGKIAEKTLIKKCTIQKIIEKWKKYGSVINLPRPGGRRHTTRRQDRLIYSKLENNRKLSIPKINEELRTDFGIRVCDQTIRNRAKSIGLIGRRPAKKPLLKRNHKTKRLQWATEHQDWTLDEWKKVMWTDETKINLFGSDGVSWVRRRKGERFDEKCAKSTIKHGGGSAMFWGAMGWHGVGNLHIINGIMDRFIYRDILDENLEESKQKLQLDDNYVFQHDNDPKHTSGLVKNYLERKGVQVMKWPPQSPDLNPIEQLWTILKAWIHKRKPTSKNELVAIATEEWSHLGPEETNNLVKSMPRRVAAVIKSKGGQTKY